MIAYDGHTGWANTRALKIAGINRHTKAPANGTIVKDPRSGDSSYRLTNINRSEPSASLFEVPADYRIRETGIRQFERQ